MFVRMQKKKTGDDGEDDGIRRLSRDVWDLIVECLSRTDRNALALSGSWVARAVGLDLRVSTNNFCEVAVPASAAALAMAAQAGTAEFIPVRRLTVSVLGTPPPSHPNPLMYFNASQLESLSVTVEWTFGVPRGRQSPLFWEQLWSLTGQTRIRQLHLDVRSCVHGVTLPEAVALTAAIASATELQHVHCSFGIPASAVAAACALPDLRYLSLKWSTAYAKGCVEAVCAPSATRLVLNLGEYGNGIYYAGPADDWVRTRITGDKRVRTLSLIYSETPPPVAPCGAVRGYEVPAHSNGSDRCVHVHPDEEVCDANQWSLWCDGAHSVVLHSLWYIHTARTPSLNGPRSLVPTTPSAAAHAEQALASLPHPPQRVDLGVAIHMHDRASVAPVQAWMRSVLDATVAIGIDLTVYGFAAENASTVCDGFDPHRCRFRWLSCGSSCDRVFSDIHKKRYLL